jgi:hypothetical protein
MDQQRKRKEENIEVIYRMQQVSFIFLPSSIVLPFNFFLLINDYTGHTTNQKCLKK